jgi:hypothetical protein
MRSEDVLYGVVDRPLPVSSEKMVSSRVTMQVKGATQSSWQFEIMSGRCGCNAAVSQA